jgi:hypothetical protein
VAWLSLDEGRFSVPQEVRMKVRDRPGDQRQQP